MKTLSRREGFTLIEMLTAMAVLILMLGLMSQMVGFMSNSWSAGKAKIDNFTRARAMLDTIHRDLSAVVLRPGDLSAFRDSTGGPALIFYTQRPGFLTGTQTELRPLSLIEYIYDSANARLVRLDLPRLWNDAISFGETGQIPLAANLAAQPPREIAPGVIAFSMVFLNDDGSLSTGYTAGSSVAVAVTLAAVDGRSLDLLKNAALLDGLKGSPVWQVNLAGGGTVLAQWQKRIDAGELSQLPPAVAGNLQLFQRVVRLPTQLPPS